MEKIDIGLPIDFHPDGTPIFGRSDIIRDNRPLTPNGLIYDNMILPEHRSLRPEISINLIVIPSVEYIENDDDDVPISPMAYLGRSKIDEKRGYAFGKILQGLDNNCRIILQRWKKPGYVTDAIVFALKPLQFVIVPPNYEVTLINASNNEPARFIELCAKDEIRETKYLEEFNGPGYVLRQDGSMISNYHYNELPIPRIQQGHETYRFLRRLPLYRMFIEFPRGFDFIDSSDNSFYVGAV